MVASERRKIFFILLTAVVARSLLLLGQIAYGPSATDPAWLWADAAEYHRLATTLLHSG